jgi:hypothetical protein
VARDVHEVTDGDDDLLDLLGQLAGGGEDKSLAGLDRGVDLLEGGDGEGSGFTRTGLGLRNDIVACELLAAGAAVCVVWRNSPLMTGMMARCWIAEGRSKP